MGGVLLAVPLGACTRRDGATTDAAPRPGSAWTTGGVAAMAPLATYAAAVDGALAAASSCALACAMIKGPCFAPSAIERRDVSEGEPGVPMLLALRVVDAASACAPVAGAVVEIWHTNSEGRYSGNDVEAGDFCTGGDARAKSGYWFRGTQTTDADGRVVFQSCFPGWYLGRAIHVHFVVRVGASQSLVSQLFLPDAITTGIFGDVAGYVERGRPDTSLAHDGVIRGAREMSPYVLAVSRMDDGVMLASKTIAISAHDACSVGAE